MLFGSIFVTSAGTVPVVAALGAVALAAIAVVYRPLLLATVSPDIAASRGVRVRSVGLLYMLALAISVGLSSLAIGAILSTALLIGPPAAALRIAQRTGTAVALACLFGVAATWIGILLAYDSYYWGTAHAALPVSFFVVAVVFAGYLTTGLAAARTARRTVTPAPPSAAAVRRDEIAA